MSFYDSLRGLGDFIEDAIGEVQEGKLTTDRGHFALNKDEGIDIKLKPKSYKKKSKNSKLGSEVDYQPVITERPIDYHDDEDYDEDEEEDFEESLPLKRKDTTHKKKKSRK